MGHELYDPLVSIIHLTSRKASLSLPEKLTGEYLSFG
jgi:hypothetical protein